MFIPSRAKGLNLVFVFRRMHISISEVSDGYSKTHAYRRKITNYIHIIPINNIETPF